MFRTLESVLTSPSLALGMPTVLAGADGLQRRVRWVHSSEVMEIASLLRGGELLLTGGQMLAQATEDQQRQYVRELAERGVAAVAIETSPGLPTVPAAVLEEAAQQGFPVVELRRRIPFVDVAEAVNGELVNESVARLRLGGELAHAFSTLLAQGHDVQALVALLVQRTGASAALYDGQGRLITELHPEGAPSRSARTAGEDLTSRITVRGAHTASLVLSPAPGGDPELLDVAAERACEALGLALLRSNPPSTRDLAGSELARLACEEAADTERLTQLGRIIGFSPDDPVVCIALATMVRSTGLSGLEGALRQHGRFAMDTTDTGARIVLSLPDRQGAARRREALVDQLRALAASLESVVVGVGPVVPHLAAVALSMELAVSAIGGRPAYGPGWVADATAAGMTHLLGSPDLRSRREQFVRGQLAMFTTLPAGDRERLLQTLETYFDQGCNKSRTAAALHLQRQSLYGRLDRAFELLGGDPTGTARALPLHLALRLRERTADRFR